MTRPSRDWDPLIAALAARRQAIVTRQQLMAAGVSESGIDGRLRRALLHRLYPGVYCWGHPVLAPGARELAALLSCEGHDVVVSHESALSLWGVDAGHLEVVHLSAVGCKLRSRRGICVHHATQLSPAERTRRGGLQLTSPARTLLDLGATGFSGLERAVSEMQALRLLDQAALQRMITTAPGHRGVARLRALARADDRGFTRSEAERRMRALCRQARLPPPRANARVAGFEVDFLWPEQRLVVEFDSYQFHGHRAAFERDRRKQTALVAAGYRVIRITWRQLHDEPMAVVAAIARALGADGDG